MPAADLEAGFAAPLPTTANQTTTSAVARAAIEHGYEPGAPSADETDKESDSRRESAGTDMGADAGRAAGAAGDVEKAKRGGGLTEGDTDMPDIPTNNLAVVIPCILLTLFLSALDMTIITTALPTIAEDLGATPAEYSWVGTAYQLAMTLLTPLNGRLSDIIGRKPMLYAAILFFTVFSALCGAAKSMTWLIVARAFQGLGGGSIIGLTSIVVADIVPLHKRGSYLGYLGGAWGVAAVLGPILGGVLTEKASWRWCFYINLPTCGIAFFALLFSLKLNPTGHHTFAQFLTTFDFVGLLLIMAGGALVIVGFATAADNGFDQPAAIALIVVGFVLCIAAIANFCLTKRNAIIPPRAFKTRTTLFFLIASTLHALAFIPVNYLLPQFFQGVRGSSALSSGLQLLPYACAVSWTTVVAGIIAGRLKVVRPVVWAGYALGAVGFGLFYRFYSATTPRAVELGVQVVLGVGAGASLQVPLLVLQAAMPLKEMAAITSAWTLTRSLGGSIGIAIFTAVLNTNIQSKFEKIPGYGTLFTVPTSSAGYAALHALPDGDTKTAVLAAFADSFKTCWLVGVVLFLVCLGTIWTKGYSTKRGGGECPEQVHAIAE
ncbi:hypothetical protein Q5752_000715 [Cryptotrichosporon argae]